MEAPQKTVDGHHRATHRRSRIGLWKTFGASIVPARTILAPKVSPKHFPTRTILAPKVSSHHDGKFRRPLSSLDEGLYALSCEEDVCFLATIVRSLKLIEHESSEPTKEPVCDSVTPSSLPEHDSSTYCFADVAGSGVESSGLNHDELFGVDDLDLNLNKPVNLNVSQIETRSELLVSEEPDGRRLDFDLSDSGFVFNDGF
nr:hypothetical protein [Tanacetum cinerariifolium]